MSEIITVNGPIKPDDLGFTLTHEHIFIDLTRQGPGRNRVLDDFDLAYQELMFYKNAGGISLIDQTTGGLRGGISEGAFRDLRPNKHALEIQEISKQTGLNIILGTGWYREPFYPPHLNRTQTNQIADDLIKDIQIGIDGTNVKAGILGEIGSDTTWISPVEERVFRAVARAQLHTGLTIATHTGGLTVGIDQLDILEQEGVDLHRVIIGHAHSYNNHEYHLEIIKRGSYVQFDRLGTTNKFEHDAWIKLVFQIIDAGYISHLLFSQDVCLRSDYIGYGGNGYSYIITKLKSELLNIGMTEEQFKQITVDNPRRALIGDK
ncbi:MAG: hypothetical protein CL758_05995 [Chloroflexi bacterium]|nr:hypothetical protein [Chloroflexota bacterium]|tara:strand:- start:19330 stop:20289 length:960 start_codon:yes stop_codon:yes gene_type:complete